MAWVLGLTAAVMAAGSLGDASAAASGDSETLTETVIVPARSRSR